MVTCVNYGQICGWSKTFAKYRLIDGKAHTLVVLRGRFVHGIIYADVLSDIAALHTWHVCVCVYVCVCARVNVCERWLWPIISLLPSREILYGVVRATPEELRHIRRERVVNRLYELQIMLRLDCTTVAR